MTQTTVQAVPDAREVDVQHTPTSVEMLPCSTTLTLPTHPLFLEVLYEQILRDFGPCEAVQRQEVA